MADMTSDIVAYFERSPDQVIAGCQNTGQEATDGIVFLGIEPLVGTHLFVGRQSVLEAVAALYGTSPEAVDHALSPPEPGPKTTRRRRDG